MNKIAGSQKHSAISESGNMYKSGNWQTGQSRSGKNTESVVKNRAGTHINSRTKLGIVRIHTELSIHTVSDIL